MKKQLLIPAALILMNIFPVYYLFNSNMTLDADYRTHLAAARNAVKNDTLTLAMDEYKQALAISPTVDVYVEIGDIYLNAGDTYSAFSWYEEELLYAYPKEAATYEFGIRTALADNDYVKAFQVYDQSVARKISDPEINRMISEIWYSFELNGTFEEARTFIDGYAAVKNDDGKWIYVNKKGGSLLSKGYDSAGFFMSGMAPVVRDNDAYFVNGDEEKILTAGYFMDQNSDLKSVRQFGNNVSGIVEIYDGSTWGYYNAETYQKIAGGFMDVTPITMGIGAVTMNGTDWALIGADGELITDYVFDDRVLDEKDILCRNNVLFMGSHLNYILVDTTGKQVGSQEYDEARGFNDGTMAAVKKNGKWLFVDTEGNEHDLGEFQDAHSFANGLAAVCKDNRWGYIDTEGNVVIDYQFLDAQMLNDRGVGFVKDENKNWRILSLYMMNH